MNRIQDEAGIGYHPLRQARTAAQGRTRPSRGAVRLRTRLRPQVGLRPAPLGSPASGTQDGLRPAHPRLQTPGLDLVGIRQACGTDCDAIKAFLVGLSPRTRYLRFFTGAPTLSTAALRRLAGDAENVDAVVAVEGDKIIGHAMAADSADAAGTLVAEIGVAVTDTRQGRGVGTALTRELAARAQARGATTMAMDVLAENQRVLAMIARRWPAAHYERSGPSVTVLAVVIEPGRGETAR